MLTYEQAVYGANTPQRMPDGLIDDNKLMLQVREYLESIGVIADDWRENYAEHTWPQEGEADQYKRILLPARWAPYLFRAARSYKGIVLSPNEMYACDRVLDQFDDIRFCTVTTRVETTHWHAARPHWPRTVECLEYVFTRLVWGSINGKRTLREPRKDVRKGL